MDDKSKKLYLELQMDELKAALASEEDDEDEDFISQSEQDTSAKSKTTASKNSKNKNADVAKLYEDAAEYEKELEGFEKELEIINTTKIKDIAQILTQKLPDEDRNYEEELKAILVAGWVHLVEIEKTHPIEQLELIQKTELSNVIEELNNAYPDYNGNFEAIAKGMFIARLETLIAIKKEHIEEEIEEIYIAGLKPSFVKRIYKEFHGIS